MSILTKRSERRTACLFALGMHWRFLKMLTDWISGRFDSARFKKEAIMEVLTFAIV